MKKLLWVGDAGVPSGFARATHSILDTLRDYYAVTVLGINYRGDPHTYPYDMYVAAVGGDSIGVGRLLWMCDLVEPDVIVIQQDGWLIPHYMRQLRKRKPNGEYTDWAKASIPVIAAVAVDGKNFRGEWLEGVTAAIFWTQFAFDEARAGGYDGPACVIPLGVDLKQYYPVDRLEALDRMGIPALGEKFIVGNVNRNQPRKRWDLTLEYFAEWVSSYRVRDAQLFLHAAPTGDDGVDVIQLGKYYGILHMVAFRNPEVFYGVTEDMMRDTYGAFDVQITTTQGEGFGLTTFEGMACGVPQIVPDWSALGELIKNVASLVPCTSTALNALAPSLNVVGGVPDEEQFIQALQALYTDRGLREQRRAAGLALVANERYRWANIGERWVEALGAFGV